MIQIDDKILSDLLIEKKFVCDLAKCKGICCVEGDSGAPLEDDEVEILENIYDKIKPYMRPEGIEAIEKQGKYVIDDDSEKVTTLVNGAECAYVTFDDENIAWCAIEQAFNDKIIDFRKPISCYLYPVRTKKFTELEAVNFDEWDICKSALKLGKKEDVLVYKFLQKPLIQKFGTEFYEQLDYFAQNKEESSL